MKKLVNLMGLLMVMSIPSFAKNRNFQLPAQAQTYNWMYPDMKTSQNPMYNNAFARQRIQRAFDAALGQKGLTRNTQNPDLLLQFHTFTQRVRRNYYGGGGGYGYPMMGWGRWGWGMPFGYYGGGYPYSTTSTNGTLVLDVTDAKTGEVLWQQAITGDVSNFNRLDRQINKGVKKLMKSFPDRQV
ncbi:hypothetical protein DYBT9275_05809 [Dyadobacter sp. CECT 9275]|uniref:DUF4136 domain-containing protein n=1 Tax=Dyadobacter helix TaxID=2822344 RepID=A0A916N8P5_9BACT|nr:DUF4136 domain-containing protein [Dyadobacter sp. CECT 9275]CAG5017609.1 hypothetical protein DYBT9275_05809 [Dyadobacter sp. CECT 9275]